MYDENLPPVVIDYRKTLGDCPIEAYSVNDLETDDGTTEGICPLTVYGIQGKIILSFLCMH